MQHCLQTRCFSCMIRLINKVLSRWDPKNPTVKIAKEYMCTGLYVAMDKKTWRKDIKCNISVLTCPDTRPLLYMLLSFALTLLQMFPTMFKVAVRFIWLLVAVTFMRESVSEKDSPRMWLNITWIKLYYVTFGHEISASGTSNRFSSAMVGDNNSHDSTLLIISFVVTDYINILCV